MRIVTLTLAMAVLALSCGDPTKPDVALQCVTTWEQCEMEFSTARGFIQNNGRGWARGVLIVGTRAPGYTDSFYMGDVGPGEAEAAPWELEVRALGHGNYHCLKLEVSTGWPYRLYSP